MILLRYWPLLSAIITVGTATPLPEDPPPREASKFERSPKKGHPDPVQTVAVGVLTTLVGFPVLDRAAKWVKDWQQDRTAVDAEQKAVDADRQFLNSLPDTDVYGLCLEALTKNWLEEKGFLKRDSEDLRPYSLEVEWERMIEAKERARIHHADYVEAAADRHAKEAVARGNEQTSICWRRKEAVAAVVERQKKDRENQRDFERNRSNPPDRQQDASQNSMSTQKEGWIMRLVNGMNQYMKPPGRGQATSRKAMERQPFGPAGNRGVGLKRPIPRRL